MTSFLNLPPGFYNKALQWQSKIDTFLAANLGPVVFMGHSLGGATASIAAVYAKANKGRTNANVAIVSEGMLLYRALRGRVYYVTEFVY